MAHTCELYFFVKTAWKENKFEMLKTVIYNLGRKAQRDADAQQLQVGVSQSLRLGGLFGALLCVEVHHVLERGITAERAMALLDDPMFTFKDGALAISLHCVSVSVSNEVEPDPFCVPTP